MFRSTWSCQTDTATIDDGIIATLSSYLLNDLVRSYCSFSICPPILLKQLKVFQRNDNVHPIVCLGRCSWLLGGVYAAEPTDVDINDLADGQRCFDGRSKIVCDQGKWNWYIMTTSTPVIDPADYQFCIALADWNSSCRCGTCHYDGCIGVSYPSQRGVENVESYSTSLLRHSL